MADRILTVPGAQLAYSIFGSGPVVISAHGLSQSRASTLAAGQSFVHLGDLGHTLVEYDARGHGDSGGRPLPRDYSWPVLAGDLLALIDEVSPDAAVDAVGASMGCATILHAVLRAPGRFRRLVLVIPPTAWETRALQAAGYDTMANLVEARGVDAFVELSVGVANPPAVRPELVFRPQVSEDLFPSVLRGAGLSDLPSPEDIARISQASLILAWAGDPGHPVSTSEKLVELLPDAELRIAQTPTDVEQWLGLADGFLAS